MGQTRKRPLIFSTTLDKLYENISFNTLGFRGNMITLGIAASALSPSDDYSSVFKSKNEF